MNLNAAQQGVGPERRGRVSHQTRCGEGCVKSRRPVNSDVIALRFLKTMHMFALPGWTIARGEGSGLGYRLKCARRALIIVAQMIARYTRGVITNRWTRAVSAYFSSTTCS